MIVKLIGTVGTAEISKADKTKMTELQTAYVMLNREIEQQHIHQWQTN